MSTGTKLPPLALVVVNYGSHKLLQQNLLNVSSQIPGAIVVVVDSFSSTSERRAVRSVASQHGWDLLEPNENVGFGKGMNLGVARAASKGALCFLLINPDATIDGASINQLHESVAADPLLIASPLVLRPDGSPWFDGADLYLDTGRTASVRKRGSNLGDSTEPWLSGACLMVSAELWNRVGGFDEEYFLYWEDVDLSYRVTRAGGRLAVLRGAVAVHDEGGTHSPENAGRPDRRKSSTYYYYNIRNRLLFAARHLDDDGLRRWRASSGRAAYDILLRGGRRQFLRPAAPLRAALHGYRDGLRIADGEARRRATVSK
jgi:N-acetylglucosaminyl-diphospho-decaprenol L-rhamnosyltransferase